MTDKKYTYAAIVPLIGGEVLGTTEALGGQLPEYVLSYTPFKNNDEHYINYIRTQKGWDGEYVMLDENEDYEAKHVDVVLTTCPCAGLSSFSTTSSENSATNDWMYRTAEYVLTKIKPTVFWGENAPRLYGNSGKKVADRLHEIGKANGYSLNLYFTESRLHGLSQKRPRTFYFFTKGDTAPIFPWHRKEEESLDDVLNTPKHPEDPMDILTNDECPSANAWVAYNMAMTNSKTLGELATHFDKTTNLIVHTDGGYGKSLLEVADWMDANGFSHVANRARRMQAKVDDGKGYWAHGVTMPKGKLMPAFIGALPYSMINPFTEKYITIRDGLRLMKMPDDFNLVGDKPLSKINHICQNVPVTTARDMMLNVIEYLDGKTINGDCSYIKQSNKNKTVVRVTLDETYAANTAELDEFFHLHKHKTDIQ
jgi:site-specific DNA-cytosine methylase